MMAILPKLRQPNVSRLLAKGNVSGLLQALAYRRDVRVRIDAARALGHLKADAAVESLNDLIYSRSGTELRTAAISALASIGSGAALTSLSQMVSSGHQELRQEAARALIELDSPLARQAIVAALTDAPASLRSLAAESLARAGWVPSDATEQAAFWIASGQLEKCIDLGAVAVRPILAGLHSETEESEARAIRVLLSFGRPAVPHIVEFLTEDFLPRVVQETPGPSMRENFHTLNRLSASRYVVACTVLGRMGDSRATGVLEEIVKIRPYHPTGVPNNYYDSIVVGRRIWEAAAGALSELTDYELNSKREEASRIWGRLGELG